MLLKRSKVPNQIMKKHTMPRSHTLATPLRINSQCSLRRVSVESPLAEDSQCFATLRRLHGDLTETALGLHCELFAVKSQSKSPKCKSGISLLNHLKTTHLYKKKQVKKIPCKKCFFATLQSHVIIKNLNPHSLFHP